MSLLDEFNADDGPTHSNTGDSQFLDYVANLSVLEKPVGLLKFDASELRPGGKSLKELEESAKRARETPTAFEVGDEVFDIHYRRYFDGESMQPVKAALDLRVIFGRLTSHPKLQEHLGSCSEGNLNTNHYMHQTITTLLHGIVNVFYAGAGISVKYTRETADPIFLMKLNQRLAQGMLSDSDSDYFTTLPNVDELDAMSSLALDVFVGRVFGTPGVNGIVDSELSLLGDHLASLFLAILDNIEDSMLVSALLDVIKEPRWENDDLGLSVYLSEIKFEEQLNKARSRLNTRLGGVSIELCQAFVDMSLASVEFEGGAFVGATPKRFLISSVNSFHEIFSKYIIALAAVINGNYPLSQTTGGRARDVVIKYQDMRIIYDSKVSDAKLTDTYIASRKEVRILYNTILKYWKDDTPHSRMLRYAAGEYKNRYHGSIDIILSASEDISNKELMGTRVNFAGAYTEEEIAMVATSDTEVSVDKPEDQPMTHKSILADCPRGGSVRTVTDTELSNSLGGKIDVIQINKQRSLVLAGMASFMAIKTDSTVELREPSSNILIGHIVNNEVSWLMDTVLGQYYGGLSAQHPKTSMVTENGAVLLQRPFKDDYTLAVTAACGNLPYELNDVIGVAIKRALAESAPAKYNNVWGELATDDDNFIGINAKIIVGGIEVGVDGLTDTMYPAEYYYGAQSPLNWIKMLNTASVNYEFAAEVDLAPSAFTALARVLPTDVYNMDELQVMHLGNMEVLAVPVGWLRMYRGELELEVGGEWPELDTDKMAVFGYIGVANEPKLFATAITIGEDDDRVGLDEPDEWGETSDDLFGGSESHGSDDDVDLMAEFMSGDTDTRSSFIDEGVRTEQTRGEVIIPGTEEKSPETDSAVVEHHVDMEGLLDEVLDDDGHLKEDGGLDKYLPTVSTHTSHLASYYGSHDGEIFASKDEVTKARKFSEENIDVDADRTVALSRYIDIPSGQTIDDVVRDFGNGMLSEVNYEEKMLEGYLVLSIDSMDDTAEEFVKIIIGLGVSAAASVDLTHRTGHKWLVMLRYNSFMGAAIPMILDVYDDADVAKVEEVPLLECDDQPATLEDLEDIVDEFEADYSAVRVNGIPLVPERIRNMDQGVEATIRNTIRRVKAELGKDMEIDRLVVVEVLKGLRKDKDVPRRLRKEYSKYISSLCLSVAAKHYLLDHTHISITSPDGLATFIAEVHRMIAEAFGDGAALQFVNELNTMDLLDFAPVNIIAVSNTSEDLGLKDGIAYVPADALSIDLPKGENIHVLIEDGILLKYNPAGDIQRANLSRIVVE